MYEMSTFIVVDKKRYIRTTSTPYSLTFSHRTRVEPVEEPSFPLDVFNFKPFNELLHAESVDENEMFGESFLFPLLSVIFVFMKLYHRRGSWEGGSQRSCNIKGCFGEENGGCFGRLGEGQMWIFGKIEAVNAGKTDWFYNACIKCPKKFESKTGFQLKHSNDYFMEGNMTDLG
ncbi:hypothetical protein PIB30_078638 [Stylosanthes scabra]|uniref:Uncharacterized protein n=1 Tax=Stylosanthes scabra TaxID=79078 RepID=A0ABU6WRQ3_9FABA|nr:hypothetical protein [Stylosanthes scabra]